jgi:DNA invertase Pin-like site-specific DNA recombinase
MVKPAKGSKPSKSELKRLYIKESRSVRNIAELLECSKDMVYRALQEYEIERRPHTWSPKLERFDLEFIRETVRQKGYRKGAEELGVDKSTLFRYLKKAAK